MSKKNETADDELVTPEEHAEAFEGVKPGQDVSDPEVPNDVEVGARSADLDEPTTTHRKVFVLGPWLDQEKGDDSNPYTEANGYDHTANKLATRQYAISNGLWPTADVRFVSGKRHPDGESWVLTYEVEVIPAGDADNSKTHPEVVGEAGVENGHVVDADAAKNYAE